MAVGWGTFNHGTPVSFLTTKTNVILRKKNDTFMKIKQECHNMHYIGQRLEVLSVVLYFNLYRASLSFSLK